MVILFVLLIYTARPTYNNSLDVVTRTVWCVCVCEIQQIHSFSPLHEQKVKADG
jgi:hypothetical protein